MDKFFNAIYKVKKEIAWSLVVVMLSVIACCSLLGCTKEDVDKYRDITDTVIDLVDEVDELEKKIEDIIGEEAPKAPNVPVAGIMMADPPAQGGMAPPPSSPNNIRRSTLNAHIALASTSPAPAVTPPTRPLPPVPPVIVPLPVPIVVPLPPIRVPPEMVSPTSPTFSYVATVLPPDFPNTITHPILIPVPTNVIWGHLGDSIGTGPTFVPDFEGMEILPEFGNAYGCLFENACYNGCA